jgi:hypothetical protein
MLLRWSYRRDASNWVDGAMGTGRTRQVEARIEPPATGDGSFMTGSGAPGRPRPAAVVADLPATDGERRALRRPERARPRPTRQCHRRRCRREPARLTPHHSRRRPHFSHFSLTCSNRRVEQVTRPDWWPYPEHCAKGHPWGPGRIIVSWEPCQCGPARAAQPRGSGHRVVLCRTDGCRSVWYEPPHDPATALTPGFGQGLSELARCRRPSPT